MAFKLAELYVQIGARTQGFVAAMGEVRTRLVSVASFAAKAAATIAGVASAAFLKSARDAAGFAESVNRMNVIFDRAAPAITRQAEEMAKKFGISKREFIDAASSFGAVFKGMGKSQAEAAALGNQLAQLGLDLASFNNKSTAEAFTALRAALRGEFDPIEQFTVFLTAAAVENEAVATGLARTKSEVTDLAKKTAALNLIFKQTADAQGDLARTASGSAAQEIKLAGSFDNLVVALGQKLDPAYRALLTNTNELIATMLSGFESGGQAIERFSTWASRQIDHVGFTIRNFGSILEIAQLMIGQWASNAVAPFEAFGKNVVRIGQWFVDNWQNFLTDFAVANATAFQNLGVNFANLSAAIGKFVKDPTGGFQFEWTPLLDGFKSTVSEFPELLKAEFIDIQGVIAQKSQEIFAREQARAEKIKAEATQAIKKVDVASAKAQAEEKRAAFAGLIAKRDQLQLSIFNDPATGGGDEEDDSPRALAGGRGRNAARRRRKQLDPMGAVLPADRMAPKGSKEREVADKLTETNTLLKNLGKLFEKAQEKTEKDPFKHGSSPGPAMARLGRR